MKLYIFYISVLLFPIQSAMAKIALPAILSDNMVLQQKAAPLIWGRATPGERISINTSWDKGWYGVITRADGEWSVVIKTPGAGGPHKITITGVDDKILITQVMIGEVWLCSGQSNMDMPMKGYNEQPILNADSLIATSSNSRIRVFSVSRRPSVSVQADCNGNWQTATPSATRDFSAVAYQFARKLERELQVPVGVIVAAFGGTKVQSWMRRESFPAGYNLIIPKLEADAKVESKIPTSLYNGMIAPIIRYHMKGFIWYQGESNKGEHQLYETLLPRMVSDWRSQWGNKKLPFYSIQIAPYGKGVTGGHLIREAQLKSQKKIPHSGLVVTLDAGMPDKIHPPDKTTVAERVVLMALVRTYKLNKQVSSGPVLKNMKIKNGSAILTFKNCAKALDARGGNRLDYFEIAGEDKKFHDAVAEIISPTKIRVSYPLVPKPVAVRYAFKDWTRASLYNSEGLPASSFRTDNWD